MTGCRTHARIATNLRPRNAPKDDPEVDDEAGEDPDDAFNDEDDEDGDDDDGDDDEVDDDSEEDDSDSEEDGDDDGDDDAEEDIESVAPTEATASLGDSARAPESRRARRARRYDGTSGMGRRSTGPARRASASSVREASVSEETAPEVEIAPDISQWPGTTDAARLVGRHTSTIKLWRNQGRIRALQDGSGCWRHHPEDLAEAVDTPDATDPGSVLANGMAAVVQQGSNASERLLRMTEIATDGLKDSTKVLSEELKRAYARISELEQKLAELRDKHALTHADDLKHERFIRRLDQKHELEIAGAKETSRRLEGLLNIVGPIAASIGARVLGLNAEAEKIESQALGIKPPATSGNAPTASPFVSASDGTASNEAVFPGVPGAAPVPTTAALSLIHPTTDHRLVPIETRITDAMARLCAALRNLDPIAFNGLRAMMPGNVQAALDDVRNGTSDSAVGAALATLVRMAQTLSDLQFRSVIPIAPAQIAAVLTELRAMMKGDDQPPTSPSVPGL